VWRGAVAAGGEDHWEVTGVAIAAQYWEGAGATEGGVGGETDKPITETDKWIVRINKIESFC
jgi:hypothetical protein